MKTSVPNMLVIGATSRNLGKTEMICRLITRFRKYPITAIKVKNLRTGEESFHGKGSDLEGNYLVREESVSLGIDDTARLLNSGARKVIYIKTRAEFIREAIAGGLKLVPEGHLIIAESNSISEVIKPGVFILIQGENPDNYKASSLEASKAADLFIVSDGKKYSAEPEEIPLKIEDNRWILQADRKINPES